MLSMTVILLYEMFGRYKVPSYIAIYCQTNCFKFLSYLVKIREIRGGKYVFFLEKNDEKCNNRRKIRQVEEPLKDVLEWTYMQPLCSWDRPKKNLFYG